MRRVLVIGSGGAGKTTFARRLAERTGLPLIHLDALYWKPGWVEPPKQEWAETVAKLTAGERWIMDGTSVSTLDNRVAACDTVIFLDTPRILCLQRVIERRIRFHGRLRPDRPHDCPERLTWESIHLVWTYPRARRPKILGLLGAMRPDQRAVVLSSNAEVERFLESVPRLN